MAWCVGGGIPSTLKRMGHTVLDIDINNTNEYPSFDILDTQDLIIVSGLEWCPYALKNAYDLDRLTTPIAAVCHESMVRPDRTFDVAEIRKHSDEIFFPAFQDFKEHGGMWLPFSADPVIFQPLLAQKKVPIGFIGQLYGNRQDAFDYLNRTIGLQKVESPLYDTDLKTAAVLAVKYRSIEVFVNLPSWSRLLVTKVYEAAACGIPVLTPALVGDAADNMHHFEHGVSILYYNNLLEIPDLLKQFRFADLARVGENGAEQVAKYHTLDIRMQTLLSYMGLTPEGKIL